MTELIETPNTPLTRSPNFGSDLRRELNAFAIIAHRDLLKLLRDRTRLVTSLIFPMIFIGILGGTFQANLGSELGYNFLTFTFTGVLAQTLFQSTAIGIVSLHRRSRERFQPGDICLAGITLLDCVRQDTRRVARFARASFRHRRFRLHHRCADHLDPVACDSPHVLHHLSVWRRIRRRVDGKSELAARSKPHLSLYHVAAVFSLRRVRPHPGAALVS